MVRSYLIENRICYEGDGGGGSAADDARESATPAQTDARGRPMVRGTTNVIDDSRQISPDPFNLVEQAASQSLASRQTPPPADDSQADLARQLINQAAQDSLANPDRPAPRDRVNRAPGRNDPMSGFFADAYDQLYGTPDPNDAPVTAPGTGIGSILSGGILGGLTNAPNPADAAAFNVGQLMSLDGAVRDPQTGLVSGAQAGRGTLSMNPFGGVVYSGVNDPNYEGAFQDLVRGTAGQNEVQSGDETQQMMQASAPPPAVDPGTTTPEQIDDLAINYLRNPYYLYSGAGNLFQPYGYAPNTLVDLLQTRNMTMPDQAAPNLNLFGNPTDFT